MASCYIQIRICHHDSLRLHQFIKLQEFDFIPRVGEFVDVLAEDCSRIIDDKFLVAEVTHDLHLSDSSTPTVYILCVAEAKSIDAFDCFVDKLAESDWEGQGDQDELADIFPTRHPVPKFP